MLDIIITSTCRKTIEKTLDSFLKKVNSDQEFNFLVNIDVFDEHYLPRLMAYLKSVGIYDISVNRKIDINHTHHALALRNLFQRIQTPLFFHLEDDWLFLENIDLDMLIGIMQGHAHIDQIRLSKERIKPKAWLYYLSEEISDKLLALNIQVEIDNVALVKTPTWSFNPSLNRTSIIKHFVNLPLTTKPESYLCQKYPVICGHQGTYIFGRIGDAPKVKDIGRSKIKQFLRKTKYQAKGGKYAEYKF